MGQVLGYPHFAVRIHALRQGKATVGQAPAVTKEVRQMTDDPAPKVRFQVTIPLGGYPRAADAMLPPAAREG